MKKGKKVLMLAPTPFFSDRGCHIKGINTEFKKYLAKKGISLFYLGVSNHYIDEEMFFPLDLREETKGLSIIERKVNFEEYLWDYAGPKMNYYADKSNLGLDMDCIFESEIKERAINECKKYPDCSIPNIIETLEKGKRFSVIWLYPKQIPGYKIEGNKQTIYNCDFDLSVRTWNCLEKAGLTKIKDIQNTSREEFLRIPYLGRTTLKEIKQKFFKPFDLDLRTQED